MWKVNGLVVVDSRDVLGVIATRAEYIAVEDPQTTNEFSLDGFPAGDGHTGRVVKDTLDRKWWLGRDAIIPMNYAIRFVKRANPKPKHYPMPSQAEFARRLEEIKKKNKG